MSDSHHCHLLHNDLGFRGRHSIKCGRVQEWPGVVGEYERLCCGETLTNTHPLRSSEMPHLACTGLQRDIDISDECYLLPCSSVCDVPDEMEGS